MATNPTDSKYFDIAKTIVAIAVEGMTPPTLTDAVNAVDVAQGSKFGLDAEHHRAAADCTIDQAIATLCWHAAKLTKNDVHGPAYDMRVAAAKFIQMNPDREPNHGDWQIDHAPDTGLSGLCPDCKSNTVSSCSGPNLWGWVECGTCGLSGQPDEAPAVGSSDEGYDEESL